jgi:hypothetical protein
MLVGPALALAVAVVPPPPVAAQEPEIQVELRGASDVALDRRLARLLAGDPLIVTRDTLIARGDTVAAPVLVLGEVTVIVEGALLDDLVLVRAGAFVRPGALVGGDLVNIAGGLYRSELATIRGTIIDLPTASYDVVEEPGRLVIVASDAPSPLQLDGFLGLHEPAYDRANGLTATWGATYWFPMLRSAQPYVHGQAGWRTEPGDPVYGAELGMRLGASTVAAGYERASDTNEQWIRGQTLNSLNYLLSGKDYRDYHEVRRAWAGLTRRFGDEAKNVFAVLRARFQAEESRSLPGDDPWHIFGDSVRPNPLIDDGRITSAVADLSLEWEGLETRADGTLSVERAMDVLDGEFTFTRVTLDADWAMHALADHTVEIEVHAQAPLSGGTLPRQRWGFVGGSGTIQTLDFARFNGDHVFFVETKYIIPMPPRLGLPLLGAPDVELVHGAGMAWFEGEERRFRQEVGVRLQFFSLYFRYMIEPAEPRNGDLDIGLGWPFDRPYPWRR